MVIGGSFNFGHDQVGIRHVDPQRPNHIWHGRVKAVANKPWTHEISIWFPAPRETPTVVPKVEISNQTYLQYRPVGGKHWDKKLPFPPSTYTSVKK